MAAEKESSMAEERESSTLSSLLAALEEERARLLEAVKDLPDDTLNAKGMLGSWSIKNVLAHLTDQERLVSQVLPARLGRGFSPEIVSIINADADAWNARQIEANEHLSPREQLRQLQQARQELLRLLLDMGEEMLQRRHPWPEWSGTVAEYILQVVGEHERGHREALLAAVRPFFNSSV